MQGIRFDNGFYAVSVQEDAGGGVTYFGYAQPGTASDGSEDASAKWVVMKQTISGSTTKFEFAEGNRASFDKKWSLRATYDYTH